MNKDFDIKQLIGLTETKGRKLATKNYFAFRTTRKNKVNYIITCDFRLDRINAELDNDLITKVGVG